jgi:hypothetical protein
MTAKIPAGLTFRAAAKRAGCTHRTISLAVQGGRIPLLAGNAVSPEAVDKWSKSRRTKRGGVTRKQADTKGTKVSMAAVSGFAPSTPAPTVQAVDLAALAATLAAGGMFADRASAELARDSYMARLRQLEFEERRGNLLDVGKITTAIAGCCSMIRSKLLAIPSEKAPAIARLKSAAEVQAALNDAITEALADLVIHLPGLDAR